MLRILVSGAAGRMGRRIIHMVLQHPDVELAGAFERPGHPAVGQDAGQIAGAGTIGVPVAESLDSVARRGDALIDFTAPQAAMAHLRTASASNLAMVIGTTGFDDGEMSEMRSLAATIRCVMAPNMSVGVNVMFRIAGEMARMLGPDYDMEILETHHRFKKDAPSGTAAKLGRILASAVDRDLDKVGVYERKGMIGERTREEIGIQTWRAGDITGEHTVMFGGMGERLELTHRAHNRDNFARGAVRAALWVARRPKGLYDMQDVLGLK